MEKPKNKHIHITKYGADEKMRQQSKAANIDVDLLAIKCRYDRSFDIGQTQYDIADSHVHFDQPSNTLERNIKSPITGYHI